MAVVVPAANVGISKTGNNKKLFKQGTISRVLDGREYRVKLDEKLQEELDEYRAADESDQVEELADLVELVYAILRLQGVSVAEFERIRLAKRERRGGFERRLLLAYTT